MKKYLFLILALFMSLTVGLANYPSSLIHMGETAGRYSIDPSPENLAGVYGDIALGTGTAAAMSCI